MNTDIITLTEILGTDSVASSRITINENFKKLAKAVGDIQTRIDTSKNVLYINVIETESGEFAIKTGPNHTTRVKINNVGDIYIGSITLDEYIRKVVNNTKFVNLDIRDKDENQMLFKEFSGEDGNSKNIVITVYYTNTDEKFKVNLDVAQSIIDMYPYAIVYVYDPMYTPSDSCSGTGCDYQAIPLQEYNKYDFEFSAETVNEQRTISIQWIPDTAIQETYSFTLQKIN